MRRIRGRTALVTGAASGIGRAIACRLADEGARLFLLDVNEAALAEVVAGARERGVEAAGHYCDLSQPAEISAAVERLQATFGELHLLINNAGVTYYGCTSAMNCENWDRLLAVNLHAPIQLLRELLPTLLAQDEAHIVNVASICGLVGLQRVAAYTTTKFALVGLSESLRAEYGRQGVGVTALCPGLVDTHLFRSAPLGADRRQPKLPPRWLLASPQRIADRTIRAIYRDEAIVVVQPYARLIWWAKRLAPWAIDLAGRVRRRNRMKQPAMETPAPQRRAA